MDEKRKKTSGKKTEATLVLVARAERDSKTLELTNHLSTNQWHVLCRGINRKKEPVSLLNSSNIFLIPDFEEGEATDELSTSQLEDWVLSSLTPLLHERKMEAYTGPLVIMSCFEHDGEVESAIHYAFNQLVEFYCHEVQAIMLRTKDFEA